MRPIILYHNNVEVMRIICKNDLGLKETGSARVRVNSQYFTKESVDDRVETTYFYKLSISDLEAFLTPGNEYIILPNQENSLYQPYMRFYMPHDGFESEKPIVLGYSDSEMKLRFIMIDDSKEHCSFPTFPTYIPEMDLKLGNG